MVDFETDLATVPAVPCELAFPAQGGATQGQPLSPSPDPNACRHAIDAAVAHVFGLPMQDLECATRGCAPAAFARQVAMYVTHVSCGMNLTDVGALFSRDRTTVAHACAVIEDRRDDPIFDRVLELLEWIVRELMVRTGRALVSET